MARLQARTRHIKAATILEAITAARMADSVSLAEAMLTYCGDAVTLGAISNLALYELVPVVAAIPSHDQAVVALQRYLLEGPPQQRIGQAFMNLIGIFRSLDLPWKLPTDDDLIRVVEWRLDGKSPYVGRTAVCMRYGIVNGRSLEWFTGICLGETRNVQGLRTAIKLESDGQLVDLGLREDGKAIGDVTFVEVGLWERYRAAMDPTFVAHAASYEECLWREHLAVLTDELGLRPSLGWRFTLLANYLYFRAMGLWHRSGCPTCQ